jgi:hypothetical protein
MAGAHMSKIKFFEADLDMKSATDNMKANWFLLMTDTNHIR